MKYIDAEKLAAQIERRIGICKRVAGDERNEDYMRRYYQGKAEALKEIQLLANSLQQEQPMPDSTKLIELWHEEKEMLKEKDFRDDPWRLAYNAFMCGFGRGIAVKKQEQPEVDLEKEIDEYFALWRQGASDEGCVNANSQLVSIYDCYRIARHFYELARRKYEK